MKIPEFLRVSSSRLEKNPGSYPLSKEFHPFVDGVCTFGAQEFGLPADISIFDHGRERRVVVEGADWRAYQVSIVPFMGLRQEYMQNNGGSGKGIVKLLHDHELQIDLHGKATYEYAPMSSLVIKKRDGNTLGPDVLRFNLSCSSDGKLGCEEVVTERVIRTSEGNGVRLSDLLRWGGRKEIIIAPEGRGEVVPWANVVCVEGFYPPVKAMENGLPKPASYTAHGQPQIVIEREHDRYYVKVGGSERFYLLSNQNFEERVQELFWKGWDETLVVVVCDNGVSQIRMLEMALTKVGDEPVLKILATTDTGMFNGQRVVYQSPARVQEVAADGKLEAREDDRLAKMTARLEKAASIVGSRRSENQGVKLKKKDRFVI